MKFFRSLTWNCPDFFTYIQGKTIKEGMEKNKITTSLHSRKHAVFIKLEY